MRARRTIPCRVASAKKSLLLPMLAAFVAVFAFAPSSALADTAPTVAVQAESSLTDTGVTLNATVNPNGYDTTYYYEYSTTSNGENSGIDVPAGADIGSGSSALAEPQSIAGLTADTTYYYKVVAINSGGTTTSSQHSFTTPQPPTIAENGNSGLSDTTETLDANVNPNGFDTTFYCEYGTNPGGPYTSYQPARPGTDAGSGSVNVPESCSLSSLSPGTTYYFKMVATNGPDTVTTSEDSFTTYAPPTLSVQELSNLATTSAKVNLTVNPNGFDTSYVVEVATTPGGESGGTDFPVSPADAGQGSSPVSEQVSLSSLSAHTTYYYEVVASNGADNVTSDEYSFTTAPAPAVHTGSATVVSSTTESVAGTVNPNGLDTTYQCEYGTTSSYGSVAPVSAVDLGNGTLTMNVSCNISGLTSNTQYHYAITATNADGTNVGADQTFTTSAPPPTDTPGATTSLMSTSVTLAGTVNPNGHDTTYVCDYGTTNAYGSSTSSVDIGNGTSATGVACNLTGLTPNTLYHYRVTAVNSDGTVHGTDATFTTSYNPPTVATAATSNLADVSVTLNGTVNAHGESTTFQCEYGTTNAYGTLAPLTPGSAGSGNSAAAVSCNVTGLAPGTLYHYAIVATNGDGTTTSSDATFTTADTPPTVVVNAVSSLASKSVTLNTTVNPNSENTSFYCEYGTTSAYGTDVPSSPAVVGSGSSAVAETCNLTALTVGTTYHYAIVATNYDGTTTSSDHTFTTLDNRPTVAGAAPSSLMATTVTLNGTVNPNGLDTTYQCEYGTTNAYGTMAPLVATDAGSGSSAVATVCNLTALTPGQVYHWAIVATNSDGSHVTADATFTTLPNQPAVTVDAATSATNTTVTLNAHINAEGDDASYLFEYGTTTAYGTETAIYDAGSANTSVAVSVPVTGLAPGVTYHFTVIAANNEGTTVGTDATFTTTAHSLPVVNADDVTAIGTTTATITGDVTPNGTATTYQFEYKVDGAGSWTTFGSAVPVGAGTSQLSESANLTGLVQNTLYDYTITAHNTDGTVTATQGQFTTNLAQVEVDPGPASLPTATTATVSGVVNPDGVQTQLKFAYETYTNWIADGSAFGAHVAYAGAKTVTAGTADLDETAALTGLLPNTEYVYAITANNGGGWFTAAPGLFWTLTKAPTITVGAIPATGTGATLQATIDPNGSATTYKFKWGPTTSYTHSTSFASAGSGQAGVLESDVLSGLKANANYHFQVIAIGAGKTTTLDGTFNSRGVSTPLISTVSPIGTTTATVVGSVNPDGLNVTTCSIHYGKSIHLGSTQACTALPGAGTRAVAVSGALTGLTTATTYHYEIVSINAAGTSVSAEKTFTTH